MSNDENKPSSLMEAVAEIPINIAGPKLLSRMYFLDF